MKTITHEELTNKVKAHAGLTSDDDRGTWTTADVAQWAYSHTDSARTYYRTSPGLPDYVVERADGAACALKLEHDEDGTVDGYTYTLYGSGGEEFTTDGAPVRTTDDIAAFICFIIEWCEEVAA